MQNNIKKIVNLDDLAAGHNKRKIIQQVRRESLIPPPLLATVVHWWDLNKNRKFPLYSSWIQIHSCSVLLRQCSMNSATCLILGKLHLCQRKASRMSSCLLDFRVRVSFSVSKARVCCTTTWDYTIESLKRECGPSICFELVLCVCMYSFIIWRFKEYMSFETDRRCTTTSKELGFGCCWPWNDLPYQVRERQQPVQSMHTTTRKRDGNLLWSVLTLSGLVPLISSSRMPRRQRFLSMAGVNGTPKLCNLRSSEDLW